MPAPPTARRLDRVVARRGQVEVDGGLVGGVEQLGDRDHLQPVALALGGAEIGAVIGSVGGPVGTEVGVVGGLSGAG